MDANLSHFADAVRGLLDLEPLYVPRNTRNLTVEQREAERFHPNECFWPAEWESEDEAMPATVRTRGYDHFGRRPSRES